jgi:putative SOS response-associated peptidase YedK
MCGRFVITSPIEQFAELFHAQGHPDCWASYNIAPSTQVLAARNTEQGQRQLVTLKWGLVPAWSAEPKTAYSTINARAETVSQKPAFRSAFRHRRCLIAADGFYEWHVEADGHKQPYFIYLKDHAPFALAGIWEHWERNGKTLDSCSIIVTAANAMMQPIHDRMPVILAPEAYDAWLDPTVTQPEALQNLLKPYPSDRMQRHPVTTQVNSPRHEGPELVKEVVLDYGDAKKADDES